jgi:hypothetical protein
MVWWGGSKIWHTSLEKGDRILKVLLLIAGGITLFIVSVKFIYNHKLKSYIPQNQLLEHQKLYQEHTKNDIKRFTQERLLQLKILTSDNGASLHDLVSEVELIDNFLADPWINDFNEADLNILRNLHEQIVQTVLRGLQDNKLDDSWFVKAVKYGSISRKMVYNRDQIKLLKPLATDDLMLYFKNLKNMLLTKDGRASFKRAFIFEDGTLIESVIDDPIFQTFAVDIFRYRINQIQSFFGDWVKVDFSKYIEVFIPQLSKTIEGKKEIIKDIRLLDRMIKLYAETIADLAEMEHGKDVNFDHVREQAKAFLHKKINLMFTSSSFNNLILQSN